MSLKSIWQAVKNAITKVFTGEHAWLKAHSTVAVNIVQSIKNIVDSPITGVVLESIFHNAIPPALFDNIKGKLDTVAQTVIDAWGLAATGTNADVWQTLIEGTKKLLPGQKPAFWVDFAGKINVALSDGNLTSAEAIVLTQSVYQELFGNNSKAAPTATGLPDVLPTAPPAVPGQ